MTGLIQPGVDTCHVEWKRTCGYNRTPKEHYILRIPKKNYSEKAPICWFLPEVPLSQELRNPIQVSPWVAGTQPLELSVYCLPGDTLTGLRRWDLHPGIPIQVLWWGIQVFHLLQQILSSE